VSVTYTPSVQFTQVAPAGYRILEAIKSASRSLRLDLVITCACEAHPDDNPHTKGEAYDVRSRNFTEPMKQTVLQAVMRALQRGDMDAPVEVSTGWATIHFFGQLEKPGEAGEHFHVQRRKGMTYTIDDYLKA
jgi:hypothetical protein